MSEVHIAGMPVTVDSRYLRQRCAWCGALLLDYDLSVVAVKLSPDHPPTCPSFWPPGSYVERDGGVSAVLDTQVAPDSFCGRLDPAVTL